MKKLMLLTALWMPGLVFANYDESWHRADYWTGEYPNGFSVIQDRIALPARSDMNRETPATLSCAVRFRAVYHAWNPIQRGSYVTMSRIVPMTVKKDFTFVDVDSGAKIPLRAGEIIEYLVYAAEGWFTVRINDREYMADQSLFKHVNDVDPGAFRQDEWMDVHCENGDPAWVLLEDLVRLDDLGNVVFLEGLDSWYRGFREYGLVTDLTDQDL